MEFRKSVKSDIPKIMNIIKQAHKLFFKIKTLINGKMDTLMRT